MTDHDLATVMLAMTIGIAMVCAGLVLRDCLAKAKWPSHAIALIGFFFIVLVESSEVINQGLPADHQIAWLTGTTPLLVPALGACIWFYIRGLTSQDDRFVRRDLWHLVPIAVCFLGALPFLTLPAPRQTAIMTSQDALSDPENIIVILCMLVAWITWIAILVLYGGAAMSRLIKHRRSVKDLYSQVEDVSLTWLHTLIIIVGVFITVLLASSVVPALSAEAVIGRDTVALFYCGVVFVVGLFGVLQDSAIPSWNQLDHINPAKPRYARSALRDSDMQRIAGRLDGAMQAARLWQNPNLSLRDVATETGVSQNNISQTLNDHLGVNFYDYVNGWRIQAACAALSSTDQPILNIAEDVGFNAKSTFNAAFKKRIGQTPRQYRAAAVQHTPAPQK